MRKNSMNGWGYGSIPEREALRYLGWKGTAVEEDLMQQIRAICKEAEACLTPMTTEVRLGIADGTILGAAFSPRGKDAAQLLDGCEQVVLMAATLGVKSERMILRAQAKGAYEGLLTDAVLSAAIEQVCDVWERRIRMQYMERGFYMTERFSPGYGDMPIEENRCILSILEADRRIGLAASAGGIMIPRKSVAAMMGVRRSAPAREKRGCERCEMKNRCEMRGSCDRTEQKRSTDDMAEDVK